MQIQPFEPLLEIPYYYPCNLPLIHEVLTRQGSESSLSLLANSRLYGLPSCSDSGLIKTYFNKLDYAQAVWKMNGKREFSDLEEGLKQIQQRISEGELFLATGTSYFLPNSEDYLNPKYIEKLIEPNSRLYLVDHWLAVYGIHNDKLFIYDPVPSRYAGPISRKAFNDFWKGNKCIPELATAKRKEELHTYCTIDIASEEKLTPPILKEMFLRTLATTAYEFLSAQAIRDGERTYYFGHAVTLQLLKQLHLGTDNSDYALNQISGFLFDMRWSRYFFRDLLQEMADRFGSSYTTHAAEFHAILREWEQAHKMVQGKAAARKSGEWQNMMSEFIEKLSLRELHLYEKLWSEHRNCGLFGKQANQEEGKDSARRKAVERIVLDSCKEINQYHNGKISVELGLQAPLYGRNGDLDSLGLVTLLASVEQNIAEELEIELALSETPLAAMPDSPYRTVGSFVGYLLSQLHEAA
ncbi:hypothetical protein [Paenibacillus sp. SI8]|uniref:hypothetical protein n=1 Tax=unclassified Paenibacillus TaxID=185978 RepID=UPI003465F872